MTALQPLQLSRTTVTASAVRHLRDQIIAGILLPGDGLPEARVGELLGVSRAPVREALTLLEREGLIAFDGRGTARVCEFGPDDVRELGLMRQALEPQAARLTCQRMNESISRSLQDNLKKTRVAKTLSEVTQHDVDFHRLILCASGHRRLLVAWELLAAQFKVVMGQFHRTIESQTRATREMTYQSHLKLLQILEKGHPDENETMAFRHAAGWLQGWCPVASSQANREVK